MVSQQKMRATSTSNRVIARNSGKLAARAANAVRENPSRRWRINTILVPVDFSAGSMPAYEFALDLAEQYEARVHLLHVLETATWSDFEKFPLVRDSEDLIGKIKKELVAFAQKGGHPVVPVYPAVRIGSPWEQIVEAARSDRIDLIIMPTHGYSGLKHLLIGSVAERVVRHAPCPVLALRKNAEASAAHRSNRRAPLKEIVA